MNMHTFDFDQLMTSSEAQHATLLCIQGETPGQTPQLDQPESPPGCQVPYGHIHARPAPPAVHGEIGWLQFELPEIFSNLAVWLAAARTAENGTDGTEHQEGAGELQTASVGHPQPEQLEALPDGLVA